MTAPIPPGSSPIPPPVVPLTPVVAPAVELAESVAPLPPPQIGTIATPPPDFTGEVLFAMMRSVETSTAAGRPHETLQVLSTLPAPLRQGEVASYFGGMALLQQGRPEDAAAIATTALQQTPDSVPLLLLAAAAEPAAPVVVPRAPVAEAPVAPAPPTAAAPQAPVIPPASPATIPSPQISAPTPAAVLQVDVAPPVAAPPPLSPQLPVAPSAAAPLLPEISLPIPAATPEAQLASFTPSAAIAPHVGAPAESGGPALPLAPALSVAVPADEVTTPAPVAAPMTPVICLPPSRAAALLLQALDLAPRDVSIFARVAALLIGSRERPLVSALFRELEASAPTHPAVRTLATLLSGSAPPEWNPWARQVASRELWQGEAIAPRVPITATPPRLARVVTELLASGEPAQALVLLELPSAPAHPQLALLRAEALLQLQRPEAALGVIREALARFPEAERPLRVVEERLLAVLSLPIGSRDARVSIPQLQRIATALGVTMPQDGTTLTLTEATLPLLDAPSALRSEVVMEARVRLLIASGRGDVALQELRQARDLRPEVPAFGRMVREVEAGLSNAFPVRSHQEAAAMLAPLRERHAELPTFLSLAILDRLMHAGEMPLLLDALPQRTVSGVVDFRGPEGTAAAQWLGQFAVPQLRGSPGGAFFIVAIAVGFVLWIAGRTGMVMLWTVACVLVALAWSWVRRR